MSYQFSTTTKHSDETHLESFVESILSASLPNEIRRNLEHLRDLDETSRVMMERWRDVQDECLRGVQLVLGDWGEKKMMEEEEKNDSQEESGGKIDDGVDGVDSRKEDSGKEHNKKEGKKRKRELEVEDADDTKDSDSSGEMQIQHEQDVGDQMQSLKRAKTGVGGNSSGDFIGEEGAGEVHAADESNEKSFQEESKEELSTELSTTNAESATTSNTATTTNIANTTKISNNEESNDAVSNQFTAANASKSDEANKSSRPRRRYIPTTEELLDALLNPSFQPPTNQDDNEIDHKNASNYYTQKQEIHTLHQKLRQFSSEKIKTAHQLQNLVDMALGRLNRDLEKFEKELGLIPSSVAAAAAAAGAATTAVAAASSSSGMAASSALGLIPNAAASAGRIPGSMEPNTLPLTGAIVPSATSTPVSTAAVPNTRIPTSTSASSSSSRRASIGVAATAPATTAHPYSRSYSSSYATGIIRPLQPILKHSPSSSNLTPSTSSTAAAVYYPVAPNPAMLPTRIGTISSLPLSQQLPPSQNHLHSPPPLPPPITKNTTTKNLAAIQVVPNTPDWILAKIQSYDKSTKLYTLLDEDVESDNVYTLPEKQVVVLKHMEKTRWARGDEVYAVYPDTTAFYHATVSQGARRLGSVGAGGMVMVGAGSVGGIGGPGAVGVGGSGGMYVMVLFQDDGDENGLTHEKAVPAQYVMKVPPGGGIG
ncbi:hypothetical protein ACHAXS_011590 [Conticribra weissflogii]